MATSAFHTHLGDQVRVSHNSAYKEPVVRDLLTLGDLGLAQVEVHLIVGGGHVDQVEVAQSIDLQLEGQAGLQVAVDLIFTELKHRSTFFTSQKSQSKAQISCFGCSYSNIGVYLKKKKEKKG